MRSALSLILGAVSLSFLFWGCAGGSSADSDRKGSLRFLALGDSYTIGEGVSAADRWPVQLAGMLRQRGIAIADPQIIARTGWTVRELSEGIDAAAPRGPFDLVTLLIGVNDQFRGHDPASYRSDFAALLARAIGFAGGKAGHVVVLSIPDWGVTPFARRSGRDPARISAEIDRFNAVNREETLRAGARYVDVTPASRRALSDASLLAPDGLHYSGSSYAEWARLALPEPSESLSTASPPPPAESPTAHGRARRRRRR